MRNGDIDEPRSWPRTSNVTCCAYRENRTTAWPAEFPPPTTTTRESVHASASLRPAPEYTGVCARQRLARPGPVVHARAEQVIDPGHVQAAPLDTASKQHRPPA